ncbi:MAG: Ig-like domain-containing protein, partial [Planctomycetota bacterium]
MTGRDVTGDGKESSYLLPIQASSESVVVADAHLLFTAVFSRIGDDLLLTGEDSTVLLIKDYFALEVPPMLLSPAGAMMPPDLVTALVGPRAPGQYAQATAPEGAEPIGQVETLTGTAQATHADGTVVQLGVGDPVFQNDVVQTGPNSNLIIGFNDDTVFSLFGNARMVLNNFVYDPDGASNSMLFNLIQGTFTFVTGQVAPTGSMRVETPVATIGIRGSTHHVAINLLDGTVDVSTSASDPGLLEFFHPVTGELFFQSSDTGAVLTFSVPGLAPVETPKPLDIQQEEERRTNEVQDVQRAVQDRPQEEPQPEQPPDEQQEGQLEEGELEQAAEVSTEAEGTQTADAETTEEAVTEGEVKATEEATEVPPLETAAGTEAGTTTTLSGSGGDYEATNTDSVIVEEGATDPGGGTDTVTTQITTTSDGDTTGIVTTSDTTTDEPVVTTASQQAETGPAPAPTNTTPSASDDSVTTDEDTLVTIAVLVNDSDPDGDPLTVSSVGPVADGSVVVNGNGTLTYAPDANFTGTDTFTYTISDGNGGTATATVTVTVGSTNDAPVADDVQTPANSGALPVELLSALQALGLGGGTLLTGFETGIPVGWTTLGNVSVVDGSFGISPTEGTQQAFLRNADISEGIIETFFDLPTGTLDALAAPGDAFDGSALKTTLTVLSGDQVTFDFNFLDVEATQGNVFFNDYAFVVVGDNVIKLSDVASANGAQTTTSIGDVEQSGYITTTVTFT